MILRHVTTTSPDREHGLARIFINPRDIDDTGCDSEQCGDVLSSTGQEVPKNKRENIQKNEWGCATHQ